MALSNNYGINDSLEYLEFEFDSFDADTTIDASYTNLNWPLFLLGRPLTDLSAMKILEVQIPFSYYVFNSSNNTFQVNYAIGQFLEPSSFTVTIPVGNYTSTSFVTAMTAALNLATSVSWTISYSNITNRMTYSVPQETTQPFTIDATNNDFIYMKSTVTYTLTIPTGTYTGTTLAAALQNAFTTIVGGPDTYTVTFNSSNKFEFRIFQGPASFYPYYLIFNDSLQQLLGFNNNQEQFFYIPGGPITLELVSDYAMVTTYGFTFGSSTDLGITNPRIAMGFPAGSTFGTVSGTTVTIVSNSIQITGPNYLYVNSSLLGSSTKLFLPQGNASTNGTLSYQMAKIPVNTNPNGVIQWQDPDPQKWFDLENLVNLASIDFFITTGSNPTKLDFNGQSFSLKLGILVNRRVHNDLLGGLPSQNRVSKRIRFQ